MIIEFAGSSCSGKSTLVRRVEQSFRAQGWTPVRVSTYRTTTTEVLRALRDPALLAWCLLNPRLMRTPAAKQILGAIGRTRSLSRSPTVVLLDEGPVKLHKRRPLRRARGQWILRQRIPAPDVLVLVTCDPETRLARLRAEDRLHARERTDEALLQDDSGSYFTRRFAAARQVPMVEVDTSEAQDPGLELCELLKPIVENAGYKASRAPH